MIIQKSPQIDLPERFCVAKSPGREGEGVLPKILGGGMPHELYDFPDPFQDLTLKICTLFQSEDECPRLMS